MSSGYSRNELDIHNRMVTWKSPNVWFEEIIIGKSIIPTATKTHNGNKKIIWSHNAVATIYFKVSAVRTVNYQF